MKKLSLVFPLALLTVTLAAISPAFADYEPPPPEECPEGSVAGDPCGANGTCEEANCEADGGQYECLGCIEDENGGCSTAGPIAVGSATVALVVALPLLLWVRRR